MHHIIEFKTFLYYNMGFSEMFYELIAVLSNNLLIIKIYILRRRKYFSSSFHTFYCLSDLNIFSIF